VVLAGWWRGFFIFFKNSLPSVGQKTLGKDSFAESLFAECRLPSVTLGKAFVECFLGFTVCTGHTAKLLIPVVPSYFLKRF